MLNMTNTVILSEAEESQRDISTPTSLHSVYAQYDNMFFVGDIHECPACWYLIISIVGKGHAPSETEYKNYKYIVIP